jgi:hypothetical protein
MLPRSRPQAYPFPKSVDQSLDAATMIVVEAIMEPSYDRHCLGIVLWTDLIFDIDRTAA